MWLFVANSLIDDIYDNAVLAFNKHIISVFCYEHLTRLYIPSIN